MAHTAVTEWNENYPAAGEIVGAGAAEIKYLRGAVRTRLLKEHKTPAAEGAGGEHLRGSAISFIGAYTGSGKAFPTTKPVQHVGTEEYDDEDDTGTVFDETDLGRLAYDTVSGNFYILTATTPTWTVVLKELQVDQRVGITEISNVTADWADIDNMTITITPATGRLIFTFTAFIEATGNMGLRLVDDTAGTDLVRWKCNLMDPAAKALYSFQFLLTGLTAGTEYIYRVQWKDVTGTLKQVGTENTRVFTAIEI